MIDTNVLISAALTALLTGKPPSPVTHFVLEHGRLLFSRDTFSELETRLWVPKFHRYLTLEHRRALLHDFSAAAEWVESDQDPRRQSKGTHLS